MRANYQAKMARLEYERQAGLLLPYEAILDKVAEEYSSVRTKLISIGPEHGSRLRDIALSEDLPEFIAAINKVIFEAMDALSADSTDPPNLDFDTS